MEAVTISEFLSKKTSKEEFYELTGVIKEIENQVYGNLILEDETGSVYVYGLTKTKQELNENGNYRNDKSFGSLGLKIGDKVTMASALGEYKGDKQAIGSYYISHESVELPDAPVVSVPEALGKLDERVTVKGKVTAVSNKSFIINDGKDENLYVYLNDAPAISVGDVVKVTGTVKEYPDYVNQGVTVDPKLRQLSSIESVEKVTDAISAKSQTPVEINAESVINFMKSYAVLIRVSGTVEVDGTFTNFIIGADPYGKGSIVSTSLDGKFVDKTMLTVTGYYVGRNARGYINILPISVEASSNPFLNVSENIYNVNYDDTSVSIEVASNVSWTAEAGSGVTLDKTSGENNGTVKASFAENTSAEAKNYTVTFKAAECDDVVVTISQSGSIPVSGKYIKVKEAPSDWSGVYLIVDDEASIAFDGSLEKLDAEANHKPVTISNDAIEASAEVSAMAFTFAPVEGGYSIQSSNSARQYISSTSKDKNELKTGTAPVASVISFENGKVKIVGTGSSTQILTYNSVIQSGSNRFRYYKAKTITDHPETYRLVSLYKMQ